MTTFRTPFHLSGCGMCRLNRFRSPFDMFIRNGSTSIPITPTFTPSSSYSVPCQPNTISVPSDCLFSSTQVMVFPFTSRFKTSKAGESSNVVTSHFTVLARGSGSLRTFLLSPSGESAHTLPYAAKTTMAADINAFIVFPFVISNQITGLNRRPHKYASGGPNLMATLRFFRKKISASPPLGFRFFRRTFHNQAAKSSGRHLEEHHESQRKWHPSRFGPDGAGGRYHLRPCRRSRGRLHPHAARHGTDPHLIRLRHGLDRGPRAWAHGHQSPRRHQPRPGRSRLPRIREGGPAGRGADLLRT